MESRTCRRCGKAKGESDFASTEKGRLRAECRRCQADAAAVRWRAAHPIKPPEPLIGTERRCGACGETKDDSLFYFRRPGIRGAQCKECTKKRARESKARLRAGEPLRRERGPVAPGPRACRRCEAVKPPEDFYEQTGNGRRKRTCKACIAELNAARYRASGADEVRYSRYSISRPVYLAMLAGSGGRCAICAEQMSPPNIDHDHSTGAVRGLLCGPCNTGIGLLRDRIDILQLSLIHI